MERLLCRPYALLNPPGYPIMGFQVDAEDQVVLNLQDEVKQTWQPGDTIVIASTDYSMHQAEEFTLLPCPHCAKTQVKIKGEIINKVFTFSFYDPCASQIQMT